MNQIPLACRLAWGHGDHEGSFELGVVPTAHGQEQQKGGPSSMSFSIKVCNEEVLGRHLSQICIAPYLNTDGGWSLLVSL